MKQPELDVDLVELERISSSRRLGRAVRPATHPRCRVARTLHLFVLTVAILIWTVAPLSAQTATPAVTTADQEATLDETLVSAQLDVLLDAKVDQLLDAMAVEDKVGQLFVINFLGNDTGIESDIALLIHAYRVGGVVISPRYRNFTNEKGADTPAAVANLINRLQALAYGRLLASATAVPSAAQVDDLIAGLPSLGDAAAEADRPPLNIPLLVAVEQTGDSIESTYLRRDFTELPTQMALGATWNPALVRSVGEIVGRELSSVGVNTLLGPNLDVLALPHPDTIGQLGVSMFGGNPYWVGVMGKAYVEGVHAGSNGRVLTAARHFPGQGDVDRLPDQEVATIQLSLDALRTEALPPFKAVTTQASGDPTGMGTTDILMPSHMRYSAFQGTGPERSPSLSLSPDLEAFIQQEDFNGWRTNGLLMSNALGLPAIRQFYEANQQEFPPRLVALDAFLAGNDLLYLGRFAGNAQWESERVNIESTISFFQDQYETDPDFAVEVDQAVRRILRAKLRLYTDGDELQQEAIALLKSASISATNVLTEPVAAAVLGALLPSMDDQAPFFSLRDVLVTTEALAALAPDGESRAAAGATVRQVARESISVLHPDITSPSETLPPAPKPGDRILIFTDSRLRRECADCTAEVAVGPDDLASVILRLYGPDATGQILPGQIMSRTFAELVELLQLKAEPTAVAEESVTVATPTTLPTPLVASAPADPAVGDQAVVQPDGTGLTPLDAEIDKADWIVFNMLNVETTQYPMSDAVKTFLSERSRQLDGKRVVVLALHAPYFLDATEISALTVYLGVYAKSQPFLENAVRVLFRGYLPTGAPPVNVPGTRYSDLKERLTADPARPLPLNVFVGETPLASPGEGAVSDLPAVKNGTLIRIEVGPIVDHNAHLVPDGTVVAFHITYEGANLAMTVPSADTRGGIAVREVPLERAGTLQISASSGAARAESPFVLSVEEATGEGVQSAVGQSTTVTGVLPTPVAGEVAADGVAVGAPNVAQPTKRVNLATLLIALFTMVITLSSLLIVQIRILPRTVLVHHLLWGVIVGLGAYVAYGVGLVPGAEWLHRNLDVWAAGLVMFLGMIFPMLWLQLRAVRD